MWGLVLIELLNSFVAVHFKNNTYGIFHNKIIYLFINNAVCACIALSGPKIGYERNLF